jgi:hypothetical protein
MGYFAFKNEQFVMSLHVQSEAYQNLGPKSESLALLGRDFPQSPAQWLIQSGLLSCSETPTFPQIPLDDRPPTLDVK